MAISIKSLGLDRLRLEERLSLVEELWDSIASDSEGVPLTGPQRVELDRRLADHEADSAEVMSWDEVRSSVSDQLKR
jgi:putative addiction module component (TIGR02574 family)